jgi:hypothetical protein
VALPPARSKYEGSIEKRFGLGHSAAQDVIRLVRARLSIAGAISPKQPLVRNRNLHFKAGPALQSCSLDAAAELPDQTAVSQVSPTPSTSAQKRIREAATVLANEVLRKLEADPTASIALPLVKRNPEATSIQQRFSFGTSHAEAALKAAREQLLLAGCLPTTSQNRRILWQASALMRQQSQPIVAQINEDSPLVQRLRKRHQLRMTLASMAQDELQQREGKHVKNTKHLSVKEERRSAVARQRPRWRHDVLVGVKRKQSMEPKLEPANEKRSRRQVCKSEVKSFKEVKQSSSWRRRSYWRLSRLCRSLVHLRACLMR